MPDFLAHAVYGRITDRTFENQSYRASGLNQAIAAIVYWNTVYMQRAVGHLRSTGVAIADLPTPHRWVGRAST
jgi:TnpA family transposase